MLYKSILVLLNDSNKFENPELFEQVEEEGKSAEEKFVS